MDDSKYKIQKNTINKRLYSYFLLQDIKHTQKKKIVNEAIIEMLDGLITATETFLRHETFTSQPGGFSLIVNGIDIHTKKVDFK